jgi:hypothetical protein
MFRTGFSAQYCNTPNIVFYWFLLATKKIKRNSLKSIYVYIKEKYGHYDVTSQLGLCGIILEYHICGVLYSSLIQNFHIGYGKKIVITKECGKLSEKYFFPIRLYKVDFLLHVNVYICRLPVYYIFA